MALVAPLAGFRRGTLARLRRITPQPFKDVYRWLVPRTMTRAFSEVYRHDGWQGGSGRGSTPQNTVLYRAFLETFIRQRKIRSVVDIGCGDWAFSQFVDWGDVDYLGVDTVPAVVEHNRARFGSRYRFAYLDACRDPLPPADLVVMKDVLQHWPNDVIQAFLPRLSAYCYALITNDAWPPAGLNSDIAVTGYRRLDLRGAPFHLRATEVLRYRTVEIPEGCWNKLVLLYCR